MDSLHDFRSLSHSLHLRVNSSALSSYYSCTCAPPVHHHHHHSPTAVCVGSKLSSTSSSHPRLVLALARWPRPCSSGSSWGRRASKTNRPSHEAPVAGPQKPHLLIVSSHPLPPVRSSPASKHRPIQNPPQGSRPMRVPHDAEASSLKMAAEAAATAPGALERRGIALGDSPQRGAHRVQRSWVCGSLLPQAQRHFSRLLGVVFWGLQTRRARITEAGEVKPEKMAKRRVLQRKPHFVKVLLGDFSQRLRIPPNFVKHFSGDHPERAILEGPSGGMWPVELQRTSKGMYLSDGWQSFVKDNTLQGLEFLLFRYEGRMHFNVSVFDTNACERKYLSRGEGSASHTKGVWKRGRQWKCPQVFGCHSQAEESRNERANSLQSTLSGCHHSLSRCLQSPQLDVEIKIEEDELPLSAIRWLPSLPMYGSSPEAVPIRRGGHRSMTVRCRRQSKRRRRRTTIRGFLSQRRPVSLEERERAYEAAESFTSKFPTFAVCMKVSSVYRVFLLMVPSSFAKAHLPRARTELVLEDPTGRAWPVRYIPDPESKLSGGWVAFARGNNLEEGDVCVFELVGPAELRVHIFRVVEEITLLIKAPSVKSPPLE